MDDNLYNQILYFYTSADRKYPQHIYDLEPAKCVNASLSFAKQQSHFMLTVELSSMEIRRFLSNPCAQHSEGLSW